MNYDNSSTISKTINFLIQLQSIMIENFRLNKYHKKYQSRLDEKKLLIDELENKSLDYKTQINDVLEDIKKLELSLEEYKNKIVKITEKENLVKTQKEYIAVSTEISSYKEKTNQYNLEINKCKKKLESLEELINKNRNDYTLCQKEIETIKKDNIPILEKLNNKNSQVEKLKQENENIDSQILKHFEDIADNKSGIGIAQVIDGICEGCNIKVAPQMISQIRESNSIVCCINCSRILYVFGSNVAIKNIF